MSQLRLVPLLLFVGAGCAPVRAARLDRQREADVAAACPRALDLLPETPYFRELNEALSADDVGAVEVAGQTMMARLRADAANTFHGTAVESDADRTVMIAEMRVALDALTVGPTGPLRVMSDRFALAPAPAARLVAAALARGDIEAAGVWLDAARADELHDGQLAACWVALNPVAP